MSGPWERYAQAEAGPWTKYATPEGPPTSAPRLVGQFAQNANDAIVQTAAAPLDLSGGIARATGLVAKDTPPISDAFKQAISDVASVPLRVRDAVSQGSLDPLFATRDAYPTRFEPQNRAEKIAAGVGQGVGTVASTLLPAGVIANAARPGTMTQGIAQALASQPLTQLASGVAGGATTGATDSPMLGLVAGLGLPIATSAIGAAARKSGNLLSPDTEETARRVLARALERDKTTGIALSEAQAGLGKGALAVEAGGQNVRGVLRGSIAAPGTARTNVQNAFDARLEGSNARTGTALDTAISPNNSLAMTVDDLARQRAEAARPAYEAAGIPRRPSARITAVNEPPQWNTRIVDSPELQQLVKDSPDIRRAVNTLRRFPDYKDVPANSMAMWDEAYKMLGGMEREAVRAGNDRKAMLIGDLRRDFQNALTDANPDYYRALKEYAGPSKLIDAAEKGKEWFTKNTDPKMAAKEFQAMTPGEKEAALVGVRDWARTLAGRSDRGIAAERVWNGGDNRERLKSILGDEGFASLKKAMEAERNAIKTSRDIGAGSRTVPMGAEAADTAQESVGPLVDLLRGNLMSAASKFGGRAYDRVVDGRTEAVNRRLAELLTGDDPRATAAYFRRSMLPTQKPGLGAVLGAEVGRQGINEDSPGVSLARALMQANERRAGAAR